MIKKNAFVIIDTAAALCEFEVCMQAAQSALLSLNEAGRVNRLASVCCCYARASTELIVGISTAFLFLCFD
jgi:hypothetical protein